MGNLFFAACVSEVDPASFHAIQNRPDEMGKTEGRGHVGVELECCLTEVVEMFVGQNEGFQLVRRAASSRFHRWHQVHVKNCSS